jgi:hypothetical protein
VGNAVDAARQPNMRQRNRYINARAFFEDACGMLRAPREQMLQTARKRDTLLDLESCLKRFYMADPS